MVAEATEAGPTLANAARMCLDAIAHFKVEGPVQYALRPSVRSTLEHAAQYKAASSAAFDDAEWFILAEAVFVTRVQLLHIKKTLENAAYEVLPAEAASGSGDPSGSGSKAAENGRGRNGDGSEPAHSRPFDWEFSLQLVLSTQAGLTLAEAAFSAHIAARVKAAVQAGLLAPRWHRLMKRLEVTPKEARLMEFLLHRVTLQQDLSEFFSKSKHGSPSPANYADMGTLEMAEFIRNTRRHVTDGLIPDCFKTMFKGGFTDENPYGGPSSAGFNSGTLQLAGEAIKACCGETLTEEDLLKIDKTAMLEVLSEEPGFKSTAPAHDDADGQAGTPGGAESLAGLKAEGDLFEMIKQEVQRDATVRKRRASDALGEGSAAAGKKLKGEGQPEEVAEEAAGRGSPGGDPMDAEAADAAGEGPAAAAAPPGSSTDQNDSGEMREYRTDLEYLEDNFKLLITLLRVGKLKRVMALDENDRSGMEDEGLFGYDRNYRPRNRAQQQLRELQGKERLERSRIERRLALTTHSGKGEDGTAWQPRLERLANARALSSFEKNMLLLLVGYHVSPSVQRAFDATRSASFEGSNMSVGSILLAFLPDSLQEQISARKFFYKSARLIKDGIVSLSGTDFSKDIMDQGVDADRRMLDFLVGLDTEFSDLVDGSHLYFPAHVHLKDVILPSEQKDLITDTVRNFAAYRKVRKMLQDEDTSATNGGGVVLLFHGQSGVGKTMMANALAQEVHKKVLLINFPSLGANEAGDAIRFIFREAKIHDALLFFDECESIFEDREKRGSHHVNLLLTEVERHDGIIIMATNRPHDLDEAMHRRITMQFEFRKPDHMQRQLIWRRLLPARVKLEDDVDINVLSMKYELSGGYIRNAVQAALSRATARLADDAKPESVALSQADLLHGAKLQLRGALRMKDFDRRRVPTRGMEDVLLPDTLKAKLSKVVQHEKARAVLMGQWGFGAKGELTGTTCLFHGPPGTGKTLAAEAVGFETGKPLKVVNCSGIVSKYVGDTGKSLDALFQEARAMDAVLVFDEAESLFGARGSSMESSTDRYAAMDVGILLHHLENHIGIVVLITNKPSSLDSAFQRRIRFELKFEMPPPPLRSKLWRAMIPKQAPLASDVDWEQLGRSYELAGGSIKNAVVRAATRAALRMTSEAGSAEITQVDLREEATEEAGKGGDTGHLAMYT
mmetsp:Transcript_18421/g.55530  ORF Transcript_18421/g.55530 Transcript_18421/m.55530 type:complete len:1186 (-) Transcript_18421:1035-4592(-)